MFARKKETARISDRTPVFHVRYIGSTETHVASGKGCSYVPVQRLWDNSPGEKRLRKVAVNINTHGILLKDVDKRDHHGTQTSSLSTSLALTQEFRIEDISFCNTDSAVNDKIFSWIVRSSPKATGVGGGERRLDCHAVLCSTKQKAQTMAIVLSRAFQIAYKDWRAHNRNRGSSGSVASATSRISASLSTGKSGVDDSGTRGQHSQDQDGGTSPATVNKLSDAPEADATSLSSSSSSQPADVTSSSSPTPPADVSSQQKSSSSPPQKSAYLPNKMTVSSQNGSLTHVTSSFHVEPQPSSASSRFMRSSILDPDVEEAIRGVDCLSAEYDLDESDSESQ